jgi:hypothetical protein
VYELTERGLELESVRSAGGEQDHLCCPIATASGWTHSCSDFVADTTRRLPKV